MRSFYVKFFYLFNSFFTLQIFKNGERGRCRSIFSHEMAGVLKGNNTVVFFEKIKGSSGTLPTLIQSVKGIVIFCNWFSQNGPVWP